jgi:D-tyrosyl-tRNA(Tyr) deacylase
MKAVVQRVLRARVHVDGESVGEIGPGLLVFLGAGMGDSEKQADELARRIVNARVFPDDQGKMNRSVEETGGELLVVSQFTLLADTTQRRPSFIGALEPARAKQLYERFLGAVTKLGRKVAGGVFGAHMEVESVNDGPVTLLYEEIVDRDTGWVKSSRGRS